MLTTIPRTSLDPFDPEVIRDSIRIMGELREEAPWVYLDKYGVYATGRHELGTKMLRDWKSFTSTIKAWGPREHIPLILVAEDPPDHTRSRNALMKFFSPVALKRYQDVFESYAETVADELVAKGEVDGTEDVGAGFVLRAFPDILGMQALDRERLLVFGDLAFNSVVPVNKLYLDCKAASGDILSWFEAQFHRPNLRPGGLADQIYQLGDDGEVPPEDAALLCARCSLPGSTPPCSRSARASSSCPRTPANGTSFTPIRRWSRAPSRRPSASTRPRACSGAARPATWSSRG